MQGECTRTARNDQQTLPKVQDVFFLSHTASLRKTLTSQQKNLSPQPFVLSSWIALTFAALGVRCLDLRSRVWAEGAAGWWRRCHCWTSTSFSVPGDGGATYLLHTLQKTETLSAGHMVLSASDRLTHSVKGSLATCSLAELPPVGPIWPVGARPSQPAQRPGGWEMWNYDLVHLLRTLPAQEWQKNHDIDSWFLWLIIQWVTSIQWQIHILDRLVDYNLAQQVNRANTWFKRSWWIFLNTQRGMKRAIDSWAGNMANDLGDPRGWEVVALRYAHIGYSS